MVTRQCSIAEDGRVTPLPISAVIQAANLFGCDIYIKKAETKINVKDYNEFKRGVQPQRARLMFYFDGADEKEADVKFRRMFGV